MDPNPHFAHLASEESLRRTFEALQTNGFVAQVVESGRAAFDAAVSLVPEGSEVMTMTSQTLESIGLSKHLDTSGKYDALRPKLARMDRNIQGRDMRKLAAAPDVVVGSVHAVTEDGHVWIASNSGSQLAAYAYTAGKVIWVAGTQKIVTDDSTARQRLYEYAYPLEDVRAQKAYGMRSGVNKILVVNREISPNRIHLILVKEQIGF
jgi:hypothetical protein